MKLFLVLSLAFFSSIVFAKKAVVKEKPALTVPEYRNEVGNTIFKNEKKLKSCKSKTKGKKGKILIAWEIDEFGKARNFTKGEDTIGSEDLYHCVIKKIEKWKFDTPPLERPLDVEHRFTF